MSDGEHSQVRNSAKKHILLYENALSLPEPEQDTRRVHLRGHHMTTVYECYKEFDCALQFPESWGWNMNALYDLLTDLSWLDCWDIELLIEDAFVLLYRTPQESQEDFLKMLEDAGMYWADPSSQTWVKNPKIRKFSILLIDVM